MHAGMNEVLSAMMLAPAIREGVGKYPFREGGRITVTYMAWYQFILGFITPNREFNVIFNFY